MLVVKRVEVNKVLKALAILVVGIICDGFIVAYGMEAEIPAWVLILTLAVFTFGAIAGIAYVLKKD